MHLPKVMLMTKTPPNSIAHDGGGIAVITVKVSHFGMGHANAKDAAFTGSTF